MKKIFPLLFLLLLAVQFVSAQQPSKADLDKMMKQAQDQMKKYSTDTTLNKVMKNVQDQQKQITDGINNSSTNTSGSFLDPGAYSNVDNWKFPPKNTALLSSLPKKIFTKAELIAFLNDIYSQLSKIMGDGISSSAQSIAASLNNNAAAMGEAAVAGWYTDHTEESLLLMTKAAITDPGNAVLLNNCAAFLNMEGNEQKAIPILKYILAYQPGSTTVLNNLGEAYAGLGETDTAMHYLQQCLKINPKAAEANNSAGQIEATKGNKTDAITHLENTIKEGYNKPAALKLSKLNPKEKFVPLIKPRVKIPEYFNLFKYKLPEQCTSTNNAAVAEAEHSAFREMITKELDKWGKKVGELEQKKLSNAMKVIQDNGAGGLLNKDDLMAQPYYEQCGRMSRELLQDYLEEISEVGRTLTPKFSKDRQFLEDGYQQKYKKMMDDFDKRCPGGEGSNSSNCPTEEEVCNAKNTLANSYLTKFAAMTKDWQEKCQIAYQKYFDDLAFWSYMTYHPLGDDDFRLFFSHRVLEYLTMLGGICETKIIKPCHFIPSAAKSNSNEIEEPECPFDIEYSIGVAKFKLSCEKLSFKLGAGVFFKYEKNIKTQHSSLVVGIGHREEGKKGFGPLEGSVNIGAEQTLFINFDGKNAVEDAGMKFEAGASAGVELGIERELRQVVGEKSSVGTKKGLVDENATVGYTISVVRNTIDFDEGPLKGKLSPQEVPLNKKVNIYTPKQR